MASPKRIPSLTRRGPTRRSLFGPIDREQLRGECQAALREDLEEASRRWAFDFVADQPLEGGDFHWEGIPCAQVPPMYRPALLGLAPQGSTLQDSAAQDSAPQASLPQDSAPQDESRVPGRPIKLAQRMPLGLWVGHYNNNNNQGNRVHAGNKEGAPGTPERCAALLRKMEKTPVKDENGKQKRKQTNITGRSWTVI